jgi:tRNA modification GTPase
VEIHTLGSVPILDAALSSACQAGARLAQPGEFTLRAFLAGRLDLTQAEAILGVIDARGAAELDVALRQLAGGLARPLHDLREQLLDLLAHLEAGLDFVEEDIEFITAVELARQLGEIRAAIAAIQSQMEQRGQASSEPDVVFIGSPNVGKSSLFNAVCGSNCAIVSSTAGTTRDYVTRRMELHGRPVVFVDTAGIELSAEVGVAAAAQQVAENQSRQAALQLLCLDATRPLNGWEWDQVAQVPAIPRLIVQTKCDQDRRCDYSGPVFATSSWTGTGIEQLLCVIEERLNTEAAGERNFVGTTAARCRDSLRRIAESLERAAQLVHEESGEELIAAEIRIALDDLGAVVGAVYTDDLLDRIFGRFCIGK